MSKHSQNRLQLLTVLLIVILGFALSLDGTTRYTIRRDELTTLGHIGAIDDIKGGVSIAYTLDSLATHSANHSPLYYALINLWGDFIDFNYFALRMLSIWFGVLSIAITYHLGRRLDSHRTGVYASILFATNIIFYSTVHEIREWTLYTMVAGLSWMYYLHVVDKNRNERLYNYVILTALTAIGFYTSYLVAILWFAIGLYHLLVVPKNRHWWSVSVAVITGGLLFIPWVPVFLRGLGFAQVHIDINNPELINTLELLQSTPLFWGNGSVLLFIILLSFGLYATWKSWRKVRNIVFFLVMMLGCLIILNDVFPFMKRIRYSIFFIIPFAIFVGYGLSHTFKNRYLQLLPVGIIVVWMAVGFQFTYSDTFNQAMSKDRPLKYPEYTHLVPLLDHLGAKKDLFVQTYYEYSAIRPSKQGFSSINNYYFQDVKMTWVNFPQYGEWTDSQIAATPIEYATGLLPQFDSLWFSYHEDRITEDVEAFMNLVEQTYGVCLRIEYGERSVLIRYVELAQFEERCISEISRG